VLSLLYHLLVNSLFITKKYLKLSNADEYTTSSKLSINLEKGDELVDVLPVGEEDKYIALFGSDNAMMVSLDEIPVYKRVSRGVVGAKFEVRAASIVSDKDSLVISISSSGYIKKSKLPPVRSRHKTGVKFHRGWSMLELNMTKM